MIDSDALKGVDGADWGGLVTAAKAVGDEGRHAFWTPGDDDPTGALLAASKSQLTASGKAFWEIF